MDYSGLLELLGLLRMNLDYLGLLGLLWITPYYTGLLSITLNYINVWRIIPPKLDSNMLILYFPRIEVVCLNSSHIGAKIPSNSRSVGPNLTSTARSRFIDHVEVRPSPRQGGGVLPSVT